MFRINFQPGALFRLLKIPLSEFTDNWFDGGAVINWELKEGNEKLSNSIDYSEMLDIVQTFLSAKIRQLKSEVNPIDRIASTILKNPSGFSIDWFADQACLCHRQLNRKFVERIGVGPKLFSRIVRFFNAYKYKEAHPNEPWLSVALEFGYSDYQHMVKDFQKFAFVTPNIWIDQDYNSHLAQ